MHKDELIFGKQLQFQQQKKFIAREVWMLHVYSHKNFIF